MSPLESSHLIVFSRSSHLNIFKIIHTKYLNGTDFNGFKALYRFQLSFVKVYIFSHSLPGIPEKVYSRKLNLTNMLLIVELVLLVLPHVSIRKQSSDSFQWKQPSVLKKSIQST